MYLETVAPMPPPTRSERTIVFLVGAIQFVNILDFMMVMPLGPDFAKALDIPTSHLGYIGGSYTAAAALSGLAGSFFLDRYDRRSALAVAMLGLVAGTFAGGLATGIGTLMAARVLAGMFGGPATSLSFSIIADVIPAERRGKAFGAVMGAFSVASVLGVPAGLELARRGGWRMPFFAVAAIGLLLTVGAVLLLPPLRIHLQQRSVNGETRLADLFGREAVRLSYAMTAVTMMGGFILIPNISAYIQGNLAYPRHQLGWLYLTGGTASFIAMRYIGPLVDRFGSFAVGSAGSAALALVVYFGFVHYVPGTPVLGIFVAFMLAMAFRNVAYNTLTSKVPSPAERARFMSLQSAVQHAASAAGAFVSARMLVELPDRHLEGIPRVAAVSIVLTCLLPFMLRAVERRIVAEPVEARAHVPSIH
jgi:predicted MFS family arabinose efflux permease